MLLGEISKSAIKLCLKRGCIKLVNMESNGQVAVQIGESVFGFSDEDISLPVSEFIKKKGKMLFLSIFICLLTVPFKPMMTGV